MVNLVKNRTHLIKLAIAVQKCLREKKGILHYVRRARGENERRARGTRKSRKIIRVTVKKMLELKLAGIGGIQNWI